MAIEIFLFICCLQDDESMEWVLHPLLGEMDWQLHGTNPPGPRKKRKRPSMSSRFDAYLLIPSFPSYYTLELHPNLFPFVVLAGQCVRYACVVRLYASCTQTVVVYFTELTVVFFCMKTYSTCINTCNKKSDSRSAPRPILFITRKTTDWIELHSVLSPIFNFFYPKNHLHGVKSRQSQSEVVLSKSAKESTRRLYSKPKTVLYILSREIDLLILICVPKLVFFVRNWGILVNR